MSRYVSPIEAREVEDYRVRISGYPVTRRIHFFPEPEGGVTWCEPGSCREHYREHHWKEGQTHG